ncbi:BRO-N domain-containing protein [Vibrio mangrovi]|uniref:BRO family protein n=1 Tax=Vibrio mangrovi TaxID=474394 RepID=A0A1Y6IQH8_9VIBR|nr:BRO family protein [Vibrio mangrovi]MDW6003313.1 BRO family protein [Vibrio mangrovi]SMR99897.1 hypothetical protein VIM7927_01133 [Vibrio mangrovi]
MMRKESTPLQKTSVHMESNFRSANTLEVFNSPQFGDLTVLTHADGNPWFIGKEVALKLGHKNINDALTRYARKRKLSRDFRLSSHRYFGQRGIVLIPESDLYRLTMKSTLPEAEAFQDWICEEVLPSIRKYGAYAQGQAMFSAEELMAKALLIAENTLNERAQENDLLSSTIEDLTHQFAVGMTIPAFCMQLNGVNTREVQNTLVTHKGAYMLYKLYRNNKLPMRKNWDHKFTTSQLTKAQQTAHH